MNQPELGMKVVELRLHLGMTQEQLAEAALINVRTIQRIEKGETEPEAFTINKLSEILSYDFRKVVKYNFWVAALHLSSILCIVIIPLLIWSYRKKDSSVIDKHGRIVLNFQLTMTILLFGSVLTYAVLIPAMILLTENSGLQSPEQLLVTLSVLPLALLIILGIICFYQGITNTLKVLNNKSCRYFLSIPFLK